MELWKVNGDHPNVKWTKGRFHILVGGNKLNRDSRLRVDPTYLTRRGTARLTLLSSAPILWIQEKWLDMCRLYLTQDFVADFTQYVRHEETLRTTLRVIPVRFVWQRKFWLSPSMNHAEDSFLDPLFRGRIAQSGGFKESTGTRLKRSRCQRSAGRTLGNAFLTKVVQKVTMFHGCALTRLGHVRSSCRHQMAPGFEHTDFGLQRTELSNRIHQGDIKNVKIISDAVNEETYRTPQTNSQGEPAKVNPFRARVEGRPATGRSTRTMRKQRR